MKRTIFAILLVFLFAGIVYAASPVIRDGMWAECIFDSDVLTPEGDIWTSPMADVRGANNVSLVFKTNDLSSGSIIYDVYISHDGQETFDCDMIQVQSEGQPVYVTSVEHTEATTTTANVDATTNFIQIKVDDTNATGTRLQFKAYVIATR